jgi:hypothetical protein
MKILDRTFLVLFARYRRINSDSALESAWRSASNKVSRYLILPTAGAAVLLAVAFRPLLGELSLGQLKRATILVGFGVWLGIAFFLDKRFTKYVSAPPALAPQESASEARFFAKFRVSTVGIFVLALLVLLYLPHRSA